MSFTYKISLFLTCFVILSCSTRNSAYLSKTAKHWQQTKLPNADILHTLYLIGDAGELDDISAGKNIVLDAMRMFLEKENKNSSIVFLGDNVYPHGLQAHGHEERNLGEKILNVQLELTRNFEGQAYMIPGNHDWNRHKAGGLECIRLQEEYVENYFSDMGKNVLYYPNNACADPVVERIAEDLVYVFMDSQWWLQNWKHEPKINEGCTIKNLEQLLHRFEEILERHAKDEIILMIHHPVKSNGMHGGHFGWKHYIFPVHEIGIWMPLPMTGWVHPFYRNFPGDKQDITNAHNRRLMGGLEMAAQKANVKLTFATGHDHGLQYFENGKIKYVVSGAGGKTDYIAKGGGAKYARDARGFTKLIFYKDETWLEIYVVDKDGTAKLDFRSKMR